MSKGRIELEIEVGKNNLRYGTIKIDDAVEHFPRQWTTSTNMNHLDKMSLDSTALGSEYTEIILEVPRISAENILAKITTDNTYFLQPVLHFGAALDYESAKRIVDDQIISGLKIIRAFITPNLRVSEAKRLLKYADSQGIVQPVFDLSINNIFFRELYLHCINAGYKLIGFISRSFDDLDVLLNMQYVRMRPDDQVMRHVSWITARTNAKRDYVRSFIYYLYGFDTFSFLTKRWNQNVDLKKIKQFSQKELIYVPAYTFGKCDCIAHGGEDCLEVAEKYYSRDASTVPSSVHSLSTINKVMQEIHDRLITEEEALSIFVTEEITEQLEKMEKALQN